MNDVRKKRLHLLNASGNARAEQLDWDGAASRYLECLRGCRSEGYTALESRVLYNLGLCFLNQGRFDGAVEFYTTCVDSCGAMEDNIKRLSLNDLANAYTLMGRWSEAVEIYRRSLEIADASGDEGARWQTLMNLANLYHEQGELKRAAELYQQVIDATMDLGLMRAEAAARNNLGDVLIAQELRAQAMALYQQSLHLSRNCGDRRIEATAVGNLANAHRLLGRWDIALLLCQESLSLWRILADVHGEGEMLELLGTMYSDRQQRAEATLYWREALCKLPACSSAHERVRRQLSSMGGNA